MIIKYQETVPSDYTMVLAGRFVDGDTLYVRETFGLTYVLSNDGVYVNKKMLTQSELGVKVQAFNFIYDNKKYGKFEVEILKDSRDFISKEKLLDTLYTMYNDWYEPPFSVDTNVLRIIPNSIITKALGHQLQLVTADLPISIISWEKVIKYPTSSSIMLTWKPQFVNDVILNVKSYDASRVKVQKIKNDLTINQLDVSFNTTVKSTFSDVRSTLIAPKWVNSDDNGVTSIRVNRPFKKTYITNKSYLLASIVSLTKNVLNWFGTIQTAPSVGISSIIDMSNDSVWQDIIRHNMQGELKVVKEGNFNIPYQVIDDGSVVSVNTNGEYTSTVDTVVPIRLSLNIPLKHAYREGEPQHESRVKALDVLIEKIKYLFAGLEFFVYDVEGEFRLTPVLINSKVVTNQDLKPVKIAASWSPITTFPTLQGIEVDAITWAAMIQLFNEDVDAILTKSSDEFEKIHRFRGEYLKIYSQYIYRKLTSRLQLLEPYLQYQHPTSFDDFEALAPVFYGVQSLAARMSGSFLSSEEIQVLRSKFELTDLDRYDSFFKQYFSDPYHALQIIQKDFDENNFIQEALQGRSLEYIKELVEDSTSGNILLSQIMSSDITQTLSAIDQEFFQFNNAQIINRFSSVINEQIAEVQDIEKYVNEADRIKQLYQVYLNLGKILSSAAGEFNIPELEDFLRNQANLYLEGNFMNIISSKLIDFNDLARSQINPIPLINLEDEIVDFGSYILLKANHNYIIELLQLYNDLIQQGIQMKSSFVNFSTDDLIQSLSNIGGIMKDLHSKFQDYFSVSIQRMNDVIDKNKEKLAAGYTSLKESAEDISNRIKFTNFLVIRDKLGNIADFSLYNVFSIKLVKPFAMGATFLAKMTFNILTSVVNWVHNHYEGQMKNIFVPRVKYPLIPFKNLTIEPWNERNIQEGELHKFGRGEFGKGAIWVYKKDGVNHLVVHKALNKRITVAELLSEVGANLGEYLPKDQYQQLINDYNFLGIDTYANTATTLFMSTIAASLVASLANGSWFSSMVTSAIKWALFADLVVLTTAGKDALLDATERIFERFTALSIHITDVYATEVVEPRVYQTALIRPVYPITKSFESLANLGLAALAVNPVSGVRLIISSIGLLARIATPMTRTLIARARRKKLNRKLNATLGKLESLSQVTNDQFNNLTEKINDENNGDNHQVYEDLLSQ